MKTDKINNRVNLLLPPVSYGVKHGKTIVFPSSCEQEETAFLLWPTRQELGKVHRLNLLAKFPFLLLEEFSGWTENLGTGATDKTPRKGLVWA
jgi:hypothetical protein